MCSVMLDETGAQRNGTIRRETRFPSSAAEWILSGPHFFVGNPLNKTPRRGCKSHRDYGCIDLTVVPDDYLPRTNYVPACRPTEYMARNPGGLLEIPRWEQRSLRRSLVSTDMLIGESVGPASERTLNAAIVPTEASHVHTCIATAFRDDRTLMDFHAMSLSIPLDTFIKSIGATEMTLTLIRSFPIPNMHLCLRKALHLRAALTQLLNHLLSIPVE